MGPLVIRALVYLLNYQRPLIRRRSAAERLVTYFLAFHLTFIDKVYQSLTILLQSEGLPFGFQLRGLRSSLRICIQVEVELKLNSVTVGH
jgi:hypothetical protein